MATACYEVAQTSGLPYRGFPIRQPGERPGDSGLSLVCRLEAGDPAGWKPALRDRSSAVAQTSGLLYRGFPIRQPGKRPGVSGLSLVCRLEASGTAGWKPALRDRSSAVAQTS
ncbi:hypothetical protein, partial [Azonexus hydrophilus]|uniref:hypothetical protein n=1 Tax=Azonexus hydrophilus TaxID=418702 RepID=UPI00248F9BD9